MCYANDEELMEFLVKTRKSGLHKYKNKKSGLLVIKENVRRTKVIIDSTDCSITRTSK